MSEKTPDEDAAGRKAALLHVRLPGFIQEDEVGLGDLVKRAAYAVGVKPCGGCEQRAAALNRWVVFRR